MRLIDADELREMWLNKGLNEQIYDTNAVLDSIDNVPTIDPVKHGYWIEETLDGLPCKPKQYRCSECGNADNKHTAVRGHYCWSCGAKMDAQ